MIIHSYVEKIYHLNVKLNEQENWVHAKEEYLLSFLKSSGTKLTMLYSST